MKPAEGRNVGRAALILLPALAFLAVHVSSEWLMRKSGNAFDTLMMWAGYEP